MQEHDAILVDVLSADGRCNQSCDVPRGCKHWSLYPIPVCASTIICVIGALPRSIQPCIHATACVFASIPRNVRFLKIDVSLSMLFTFTSIFLCQKLKNRNYEYSVLDKLYCRMFMHLNYSTE